jgi:hypothetical protein
MSLIAKLTKRVFSKSGPRIEDPRCSTTAGHFILDEDFDFESSPSCPNCKANDSAFIIYGKPLLTRKIITGFESGRLISGGCMVRKSAPKWHCQQCGIDFGTLE